jgi:hypothetical protein
MKLMGKALAALPAVAILAAVGPVSAQSTSQTTTTTQQTTTTTPYYHRDSVDPNADVLALHNQAVYLAHQATYAAQHGNPRQATILAGQAQELFNRAFTLSWQSLR